MAGSTPDASRCPTVPVLRNVLPSSPSRPRARGARTGGAGLAPGPLGDGGRGVRLASAPPLLRGVTLGTPRDTLGTPRDALGIRRALMQQVRRRATSRIGPLGTCRAPLGVPGDALGTRRDALGTRRAPMPGVRRRATSRIGSFGLRRAPLGVRRDALARRWARSLAGAAAVQARGDQRTADLGGKGRR